MAVMDYQVEAIRKRLEEQENREMHPLRVYRPTEAQLPVHESNASEILTIGGKRCLAGWQVIVDPTTGKRSKVQDIKGEHHVWSRDPATGGLLMAKAGKPFTKGEDDFYEFTLSNGHVLTATAQHQVLTQLGWLSLVDTLSRQQACGHGLLVSSEDISLSAFPRDGLDWSCTAPDCPGHCWPDHRPCDAPPQLAEEAFPASAPSLADARECIHSSYYVDGRDDIEARTQTYQWSGHLSSLCAQDQTSGHEDASGIHASCRPYSPPYDYAQGAGRSPRPSFARPHTSVAFALPASQNPSDQGVSCLASYLAVSIVDVRYIGKHTVWDFEVPETGNYCCAGIISHNSGKTTSIVLEMASRLTGIPITRQDGTKIPLRFRVPSKKNPGLYWVIGMNSDHIGQTIYHRLFSPGLGCNFRIIKDLETKQWRAYNPNGDKERYQESRQCPPIFGDRDIDAKSWHMESAAGNIFKSVSLLDGAVMLCAYPSTADSPKKGDAVDGIWIDEDIEKGAFLKEWQDRLISTDGWFLWSVWPQIANQALIRTLDRAKDELEKSDTPPIRVFRLIGSDNPYSDKEGIAKGLARMDDDDDMAHRDRGDIDAFIAGRRMYDFASTLHVVKPPDAVPSGRPADALEVIRRGMPKLPQDWTRYLSIDPSHTRTAIICGVVPPPEVDGIEMGNRLIVEWELLCHRQTPAMVAESLKQIAGSYRFEAFVMDDRMGRQTTVAADMSVFQAYEVQFRARGLMSRVTKYGFMRGCSDKSMRRRTVRDLLEPIEGGTPRLLVSYKCPQVIKEFYTFRKAEIKDMDGRQVPTDDGASERLYDAVIACEYLAQYVMDRFRDGTAYVSPENFQSRGNFAYHFAMALIDKQNKDHGGKYVHLGPGEAA